MYGSNFYGSDVIKIVKMTDHKAVHATIYLSIYNHTEYTSVLVCIPQYIACAVCVLGPEQFVRTHSEYSMLG